TTMKATLQKAFGYQGDNMNLPVKDVAAALPFYEIYLGFQVLSRSHSPCNSAVLARDEVQMALAENGGDSAQDGCAFHMKGIEALREEFEAKGLTSLSQFKTEERDGTTWKVFFVIAPDELCYWFGEQQSD